MSWRIPGAVIAGIIATFAVLWVAASLASRQLYAQLDGFTHERVVLQPDCDFMEQKADELFPLAQICGSDSDCFHYPCRCASLAKGSRKNNSRFSCGRDGVVPLG